MQRHKNIIIASDDLSPDAIEVPVLKVFDGDGFLTRIDLSHLGGPSDRETAVRFGFIDAPELDQPGGREAREFLAALIDGTKVWVDPLVKSSTQSIFDDYGRLICVPFIVQNYARCILKTDAGHYHLSYQFGHPIILARNIELEMVLNGWAWVLERYGPDGRYLDALNDARADKRGIWALEDNEPPWKFKQRMYRERRRSSQPGLPGLHP